MSSPYTTRSQINDIYGAENVNRWADLDNEGNEEVIEATINSAIQRAEIHLNGRLAGGPYTVPITTDPNPVEIAYLAALKAGVLLWNGRQVVSAEDPNQVTQQDDEFDTIIRQIHARTFKITSLEAVSTDYPKVLKQSV